MKLSIIIPCYNEDQTIKPLLESLFEVDFEIEREIIVVDDGSKRNHRDFIKEEISSNMIKFIRLHKNQGKGVAIRVGLRYAEGDIFIIQDADFEYFPSDIPTLLKPILNREVDVVYGTRFANVPQKMATSHLLGNIFLTKLTNLLYNVNLTDMETGYKLFTKKVLDKIKLTAREFEFEPELTAKVILKGFKIKELPITYHYRHFGFSKINLLDGLESVLILFKHRFFENSKLFQKLYYVFKFHLKGVLNKFLTLFFRTFRI